MMTIHKILNELTPYTGRFPMKAMRAALQQCGFHRGRGFFHFQRQDVSTTGNGA